MTAKTTSRNRTSKKKKAAARRPPARGRATEPMAGSAVVGGSSARGCLEGAMAETGAEPAPTTGVVATTITAADRAELHRRWEQARRVVHDVVGKEGEHDPQIWERGVYQLWLWLVVERLVVRRDDMDVAELSVVSKMLYDQRRVSLNEAKRQQQAGDAIRGNGAAISPQLPEHFGELVRQIYGTNLQDSRPAAEGAVN